MTDKPKLSTTRWVAAVLGSLVALGGNGAVAGVVPARWLAFGMALIGSIQIGVALFNAGATVTPPPAPLPLMVAGVTVPEQPSPTADAPIGSSSPAE
jgi:hypothetical protein